MMKYLNSKNENCYQKTEKKYNKLLEKKLPLHYDLSGEI